MPEGERGMSLREAAQQALEAMACMRDMVAHPDNLQFIDNAITALRTALSEPEQEPVQVTPIDFVTAVLGKEDCVGKPIMWAEWPNRAHGIGGEA
jgi:hypothetical protein